MKTPNNPPAFPTHPVSDGFGKPHPDFYHGMSLRDWLASNESLSQWDAVEPDAINEMCEALAGKRPDHGFNCHTPKEYIAMLKWEAKWRAALKYIRADAMLNEREKGN
jgi:hypothetical protein